MIPAVIALTLLPRTRWGWIALVVVLLILAVAAYLVLRAVRRRRLAGAESKGEDGGALDLTAYTRLLELRKSFIGAVGLLRSNTAGRSWRYQIPWFMMVGEASVGKRSVLRSTGLNLPLGRPREEILGLHPGASWWFYDSGVILDVFGDYMLRADGTTSDATGWRTVLRLLRKYRSGRPIDGVILAIPAKDLAGAAAQSPEHRARLAAKGEHLRRKLAEAQKVLGMRFPVYVLVTQCNEVRGFASFAREVGTRRADDIFGWSSPYALEAGYASPWVDEAFDTIARDLHEVELELFASDRPVADGDGLFVFPSEFRAMREPVRTYLDALFKHSVYQESFFFRGVYFCGDAGSTPAPVPVADDDEDAEGAPRATRAPDRNIVFVKDVLEKKVFPEYRLARPAPRAFVSKTRALLATQAAVAIFVLLAVGGLVLGYRHFTEARRTLTPLLRDTLDDVREARGFAASGQNAPEGWFHESALNLLKGMANVSVSTTATLWVPTSYLSPLDAEVRRSLTVGYDEIIAKSMYRGLVARAGRIVGKLPGPPSHVTAGPGEVKEFAELLAYVAELKAYEDQLDAYTGLRSSHDLRALAGIVKYLAGIVLPEDFYKNAAFYQEALYDVQYVEVPVGPISGAATLRFKALVDRLHARLLESPEVREQLKIFVAKVDAFDRRSRAGGGSPGMFRDLLDSLNRTEATLGRPEVAVLAIDRFTLGPPWDTMLAAVEQSKFLGPKVRAEVEREGNAHLQRARHELESQTTAITGPVIERKPTTGALAMSSGSFALKSALEGVLSLRGAEATPKATPRLVLTGAERLVWDTKPLIEALHLYEQYEQFMAGEAKRFPEYLEGFVRRGALRNLEINMMELVTKAADIRPGTRDNARAAAEQDLRQETRSFRDANRALVRLLEVFRQLGFTTSYRDLTAALTTEAGRMLRDVDRVLNEDTLYSVKEGSIARWDGTRRLALTAFEATDAKDLEQYLDLQRERVRLLARDYADPAVSWLTSRADRRTPEQARLIAKWQRISSELERYDAKKPGNSITTLERFILVDMEQITRRNYFQKISARDLTEESADFFLQKRNALRRDLYRRAQAVGDSAAATEYAEIESFFNRRLAGRFPFAEPKAIRVDAEADIETIREFYAVFDRYGKPAREVLKRSVRFAGGNEAAIDFLDQMDAVRMFLAPLLDRKNPAPGFDLDVDFRVNREREIGGRQIIDWTMAVGEQRIRYRDAKRQAKWQVGDPIRVSLRWAKDYPFAPTSDGSEGVTIEDRTVTWDFLNNWSLLAVLMRHTAGVADGETIADPRPTMLRFGVAMRPDRVAGAPAEAGESQARVYIRTVLTAGEKKDPLRLPQFPARAPQLTATARR